MTQDDYGPQATGRRRSPERRTSLLGWLLLGLALGVAGGLLYAWVLSPVIYVDASPARLAAAYQSEYLFLVSQSYAANGDWAETEARLDALDKSDVRPVVADQLELYLRQGWPPDYVRNMATLAREIGVEERSVALFAPTPAGQVTSTPLPVLATATATLTPRPTATATVPPTATPSPSPTSTPTRLPSPTPRPDYRLLSQERVCDRQEPAPRIEVVVLDALLEPLPGVEALISWESGADHLFTGFKPDEGPGYGDFTMSPDLSYSVVLADGSPTVSGLRVEPCPQASGGLAGGWRLTFQNLVVGLPTPEVED